MWTESSEVYFWRTVRDRSGRVYVSTGDGGHVLRVEKGSSTEFASLDVLEVMALDAGKNGTLYAAGAPGGTVSAVSRSGEVTKIADTEQGVVWDLLALDSGDVLAATGEKGTLVRISPDGSATTLYESPDPHVMCITALEDSDDVLIGTAGDGLVCRVSPSGEVRVLYDADEEEVRSIVVDEMGAVFVAVNVQSANGEDDGARPAIYRLSGTGTAQRVWESTSSFLFDLLVDDDGSLLAACGDPAAVFRVDPKSRRASRLAEFDESNALSLLRGAEGRLLVSTGDPARLYALGTRPRSEGSVESDVRDAGAEATWSRIRWVGAAKGRAEVDFETRTGNRRTPDGTWSEWRSAREQSDGSFIVESASGRFFQWRVNLKGALGQTPYVHEVTTSYREVNLSPEIAGLEVSRKGAELFGGADGRPRSVRTRLDSGIEVDYSLPMDSGGSESLSPSEAQWALGLRTVSWLATDPNGDEIQFDLRIRPEDSDRWMPLADDLLDLAYTWDTSTLPDGEYRIELTAKDDLGNADGDARVDRRESAVFEIDNTSPESDGLSARIEGGKVTLKARGWDERSAIVSADVTFDGQTWKPVRSSTGLLDAKSLTLEATIAAPEKGRGDPVILRLLDEAGNQVVARTTLK
jgi:hypothetical protein